MWEIRAQPYDIITYLSGADGTKRKVGQVGDVHSGICTAGRITQYEVRGPVWEDVEEIDNCYDPRLAEPGLVAEFKAARAEYHVKRRADYAADCEVRGVPNDWIVK